MCKIIFNKHDKSKSINKLIIHCVASPTFNKPLVKEFHA